MILIIVCRRAFSIEVFGGDDNSVDGSTVGLAPVVPHGLRGLVRNVQVVSQVVQITIKKGLDIPLTGRPRQVIGAAPAVTQVALLGADYAGLRPRMLVEIGQAVGLGEPLFVEKRDPAVSFVAPGNGCVVAINRGQRRTLQSVVIELDESAAAETVFTPPASADPAVIRDLLLQSGLWTAFRTRPFNRVPESATVPRSIFVTAIDTRPLAVDPGVVIAARAGEFERGLEAIADLCDRPIYLCTGPDWSGPEAVNERIRVVKFSGPHPAGLPGTHIHFLDPVAADRTVWHIGYQDVIAIGHLCRTGRLLTERVVSVAGPGAANPRLVRTRPGASVSELMTGEILPDGNFCLVSGSVLDGFEAAGPLGFLGRYHHQVSVIPEGNGRRLFGWFAPGGGRTGIAARLRSVVGATRPRALTTARHGRRAVMIPAGAFERVMPLDMLPTPLLRALLVKDTVAAEALGCLELAEEDLALSSFVCPAKQDYGAALRINLAQIEKDG